MIVEGALVDADGTRKGYARFRDGRIVETGATGTASAHGGARTVHGIVVPAPVNGHTHLGDAVSTVEPPHVPVAELVRPPDGLKFRLLSSARRRPHTSAMRHALDRMTREGVAVTIDFREQGIEGVRRLRAAERGGGTRAFILGRPLRRPLDATEMEGLLAIADGVGLSSALEEAVEVRTAIAERCHRDGKRFALHASEATREPPETYLSPRPDLLVHLACATTEDLEMVAAQGVTVAACVRGNALFGRRPDLASFHRLGIRTLLGTDNAMFHAPSIWRELEYAYLSARAAGAPVPPSFLVRAAMVEPWRWLGRPDSARLVPEAPDPPIAFRLPPDDPEYQLATRATEHLMVRTRSRAAS